MATVTTNTDVALEFKTFLPATPPDNLPFIIAQIGAWDISGKAETGIVIDCSGPDDPPVVLTGDNARKLAKWLTRAADKLDAADNKQQKKKRAQPYEQDDDDYRF